MFKGSVGALLRLVLAVCFSVAMAQTPAAAQMGEGTVGWTSGHTSEKFVSPYAACYSQWERYRSSLSSFVGAVPRSGDPATADCDWTTYHRGCDGGISGCGTILPAWVWLTCASGYSGATGVCLKDPVPERPCNCNNGSSLNPQVGHPIVLSSGAKVLGARDYETADGDFVIGRSYRSIQVGRSVSYQRPILGLAGGWNFDFAYEVQLASFSGSPASPSMR